jgi:Fe-S-cluster containining protein
VRRPLAVDTNTRTGSDLCARCGLCCDGSLFNTVGVDDDEAASMVESGLSLEPFDEPDGSTRVYFRQPCIHYHEQCCTIYERRPRVCERYTCRLLDGYRDGTKTAEECLKVVAEMRGILTELVAYKSRKSAPGGAAPHEQLALASYEVLKKKYFRRDEASS